MSLPRQLVDRFVITKQSTGIFYIRWPLPNTGLACRESKHSTTIHQLYSIIRNPPLANPIPTVLLRPLVVFCNAVRLLAFVPKSYPFISASYPSIATMRRIGKLLLAIQSTLVWVVTLISTALRWNCSPRPTSVKKCDNFSLPIPTTVISAYKHWQKLRWDVRRMSLVLRLADNKPCEIYALVPIVRC